MAKKNNNKAPLEVPKAGKHPELPSEYIPEDPVIAKEDEDVDNDADTVYDEDVFETPPYETPPPGEGP